MTFFYGGLASEDEVLKHVEEICEPLKPRKRFDFPQVSIPVTDNKPSFLDMDREQTHLFVGKSIAGLNDQEQTFYKILSAHLSGQSSNLFSKCEIF